MSSPSPFLSSNSGDLPGRAAPSHDRQSDIISWDAPLEGSSPTANGDRGVVEAATQQDWSTLPNERLCQLFLEFHDRGLQGCLEVLESWRAAGCVALEFKNRIGHARFEQWLDEQFCPAMQVALRTVRRYMFVAKNYSLLLKLLEREGFNDADIGALIGKPSPQTGQSGTLRLIFPPRFNGGALTSKWNHAPAAVVILCGVVEDKPPSGGGQRRSGQEMIRRGSRRHFHRVQGPECHTSRR